MPKKPAIVKKKIKNYSISIAILLGGHMQKFKE